MEKSTREIKNMEKSTRESLKSIKGKHIGLSFLLE